MERKEFSSVAEAIEALNDIKNIDYSSVDSVDEVTEREFYGKLMNNLMGTKNLTFTAEERENYKAALRKKGLLTYREWKDRQSNPEEKITWAESANRATLDAPVNTFSKILYDDDKFDVVMNLIVKDERKLEIADDWMNNNKNILEAIRMEKQTRNEESWDDLLKGKKKNNEPIVNKQQVQEQSVEKDQSQEEQVETIENSEEISSGPVTDEKLSKIINQARKKEEQEENKLKESQLKFNTPEEAIEALKSIEKIKYDKNSPVDKEKETAFYNAIIKNMIAAGALNFKVQDLNGYQDALKKLGCKTKDALKEYRDSSDTSIDLPEEYIDAILSAKIDPRKKRSGKEFRKNVNNIMRNASKDDELKEWIENPEKSKKEKETALVPYKKKPSLFKRIKTYGAMIAATIATSFGVAKTNDNIDKVENAQNRSKIEYNVDDEDKKDKEKAYDKQKSETEKSEDEKTDFEKELSKETNYRTRVTSTYKGDPNYTFKHENEYGEVAGNENIEELEENRENDENAKKAEQAQKEAAEEELVIEVKTPEENKEENKFETSVGDDGKFSKDESTQSTINQEDQQVEDSMEKIEIVVDFDAPVTYSYDSIEYRDLGISDIQEAEVIDVQEITEDQVECAEEVDEISNVEDIVEEQAEVIENEEEEKNIEDDLTL